MADTKDTTRSEAHREGAIDARGWLPAPVRQLLDHLARRFPRTAVWLTALAVVLAVLVLVVQQGPAIVKTLSDPFTPAAHLTLRAEPAQPGRLVATVENTGDRPLLVGGVAVKVLSSTPAPFRRVGQMDIPLAQSFSMVLSPRAGHRSSLSADTVTVPPRAAENIVLNLGTEGDRDLPWIRYELELTVESPGRDRLAIGRASIDVPVSRK